MSTCPVQLDCYSDTFDADPDIAGIGVILAFLISAWCSLFVITFEYVSLGKPNQLDNLLIGYIKKIPMPLKKPWTLKDVEPAILMVGDQQLITGTAILTVGFIQHCTITQYHTYITSLLGFISFQIYDTSLIALNGYVTKHPSMKLWRAVMVTILFVMLILSTIIVNSNDFYYYPGSATQCIWSNVIGLNHYQDTLIDLGLSLFILVWGYYGEIGLFYPQIFKPFRRIFRAIKTDLYRFLRAHGRICQQVVEGKSRPDRLHQINTETDPEANSFTNPVDKRLSRLPLLIMTSMSWVLLVIIFTLMGLLGSRIVIVWRIYSALLVSTILLLRVKQEVKSQGLINGDEDEWGFGQILPLLLLLLPATSLLEIYQGE
ncbi:hypothetical protein F5B19DRAFT_458473 [Rostrohypoxylon terebratum]|nr:hypothetical protein F5B19DRAFT_458473 [Rostrohypoxylon terebratum]